ncbi:hypothetical protein MC7420_1983 [Coleofasciculus chthonoplastes PCC 7420]|uniref:Uncharacterized protein n=1 Tax=Coleofasciculus chthonoplastes PCC 7420 TaxID=118168 RepID=B4VME1_9CYAN|nr:hypothetical protein MC7420_1983 [Coleofasciculus chthonoplastes PCC 7420]
MIRSLKSLLFPVPSPSQPSTVMKVRPLTEKPSDPNSQLAYF